MLNAFYALKGQYASKEKLAKEAIYLERVLCAEAGGWQDQIAAAFGGFNRIDFSADGYEVRPVLLSPERKRRLNGRLMMFFTGFTRFSAEIQKLNNSRNGADKLARLQEMLALVDEAEAILTDEQADLNEFGRLLDHTWKLKRGTGAAVSTDCIDALYARGIAAGALGGKLLGAGGGGFLVFYVEPEHQAAVRQAMQEYSAPQPRGIQCQNLIYLIYYLWMNKQVNHADTQTNQNKQRKPSPVSEIVIDSRKHQDIPQDPVQHIYRHRILSNH